MYATPPQINHLLPLLIKFAAVILGYRKTRLQENELIIAIDIPFAKENEYIMSYMQSRRREDDIAIASAAFRVVLSRGRQVEAASLVFGGMDAFTKWYAISSAAHLFSSR
jgi:xanthine dehydrogenase iron-sulfur cluster and FAD-binding subunit A